MNHSLNYVRAAFLTLLLLCIAGVARGQVCTVSNTDTYSAMNYPCPDSTSFCGSPITIPVVFHVLHKTGGAGFVSISEINAQMRALNAGFNGTDFSFYLAGVHYVKDNSEFPGEVSLTLDTAHSIDVSHVLNVFVGDMPEGDYGYASLPSSGLLQVLIDYVTLPGGAAPPVGIDFDAGDILVHEVGHYMGLLHVYEGDVCEDRGDHIKDTPSCQLVLADHFGKNPPDTTNTCPEPDTAETMPDPIDNFMHVSRRSEQRDLYQVPARVDV